MKKSLHCRRKSLLVPFFHNVAWRTDWKAEKEKQNQAFPHAGMRRAKSKTASLPSDFSHCNNRSGPSQRITACLDGVVLLLLGYNWSGADLRKPCFNSSQSPFPPLELVIRNGSKRKYTHFSVEMGKGSSQGDWRDRFMLYRDRAHSRAC